KYLGGLTGLFDDFFDKKELPDSHIQKLFTRHNENDANDSHELLFIRFYNAALKNIYRPDLFMQYVNKVFEMQILSRKQKFKNISKQEIKNITFDKGGYSLLFYRSALENIPTQEEKKALYQLGSLLQLENDLFDVYKDYRQQINTLVTAETDIRNVRHQYFSLMDETTYRFRQLPFPARNTNSFLRFMSLIVFRGIVCLNQLESLQKSTNKVFSLNHYTKKDLICDMEKASNILSVLRYYAKGW
ncbi:MAG: class 1 isoprenoid biosynthesis enzyme, partial [Bacteroidota bacterium]